MFFKGTRASIVKSEVVSNFIYQYYDIDIMNENVIEDKNEYKIYSKISKSVEEMCRTFSNNEVIRLGKGVLLVMYSIQNAKDCVNDPAVSLEEKRGLIQFAMDAFITNLARLDCNKEQNIFVQKARSEIKDLGEKCDFIPKDYIIVD